ncbi:USE1-like protein [Aphelenchoides bicaudatus]|nr:USE1-like protein [Aphelenchoides bicaudatus]
MLSNYELNFQRLMSRSRKLCRDNLNGNLPRLQKAVDRLQLIFIQMQADTKIDSDVIMQYGRDLQQLKIIVEAEGKKTTQEKIMVIDKIPKHYNINDSSAGLRKRQISANYGTEISNSLMKAQTEATYRADLRRQLLGEEKEDNSTMEQHEEEQQMMAKELLRLTSEMKRNFEVAGTIIREDNVVLGEMQSTTENNRSNLERESKRLEVHAYKSCFDCLMFLVVILVVWSFIGMVLIMKVFPKRY